MGEAVRYDGGDSLHHLDVQAKQFIQLWQQRGLLFAVCPEVLGGLPVPRAAAEIQGDRVMTMAGDDVTQAFVHGANQALDVCQRYGLIYAILKQGSPSCGNTLIHDGSFTQQKVAGQGMTTRLLQQHGISVFNETELAILALHLQTRV